VGDVKTPEERRAYDKAWRAKQPNYRHEEMKQWRKDNKETVQQESRDYYDAHREKILAYLAVYRRDNKETLAVKQKENQHRYRLSEVYGITEEEYAALLSAQGGKCAVCGGDNSSSRLSTHLFVDHDHKTGKIRGLLCNNCNMALGFARENPDILLKLRAYLLDNCD
jgi:DNA repair exonuclease SbcCD ATPase subunit